MSCVPTPSTTYIGATMFIALTNQAYEYWRDIGVAHKSRPIGKVMEQFDGEYGFKRRDPSERSMKGLQQFICNFLANPTPHIPSRYYSTTSPYRILSEYFIDLRDDELKKADYKRCGAPGQPTRPSSMKGVNEGGYIQYYYTTWNGIETETTQHKIKDLHHDFLITAHQIVYYWKLSIYRPPRSQKEALSALLNSIGVGYLWHPLLAPNPYPGPRADYYELHSIAVDAIAKDEEYTKLHPKIESIYISTPQPTPQISERQSRKLTLPTQFNLGQPAKTTKYKLDDNG